MMIEPDIRSLPMYINSSLPDSVQHSSQAGCMYQSYGYTQERGKCKYIIHQHELGITRERRIDGRQSVWVTAAPCRTITVPRMSPPASADQGHHKKAQYVVHLHNNSVPLTSHRIGEKDLIHPCLVHKIFHQPARFRH